MKRNLQQCDVVTVLSVTSLYVKMTDFAKSGIRFLCISSQKPEIGKRIVQNIQKEIQKKTMFVHTYLETML